MIWTLMNALKTDTKREEIVEYFCFYIFVFFVHKNNSRNFIKLRLNHWCHIDYFNDVLTIFLRIERGGSIAVYGGSESSWILLKIS